MGSSCTSYVIFPLGVSRELGRPIAAQHSNRPQRCKLLELYYIYTPMLPREKCDHWSVPSMEILVLYYYCIQCLIFFDNESMGTRCHNISCTRVWFGSFNGKLAAVHMQIYMSHKICIDICKQSKRDQLAEQRAQQCHASDQSGRNIKPRTPG